MNSEFETWGVLIQDQNLSFLANVPEIQYGKIWKKVLHWSSKNSKNIHFIYRHEVGNICYIADTARDVPDLWSTCFWSWISLDSALAYIDMGTGWNIYKYTPLRDIAKSFFSSSFFAFFERFRAQTAKSNKS